MAKLFLNYCNRLCENKSQPKEFHSCYFNGFLCTKIPTRGPFYHHLVICWVPSTSTNQPLEVTHWQ